MKILYAVFMFLIGACMGSFFSCIGYRIPNKIGLFKPDSHCENCNKPLKWYMNIPIISYIMLKGRCAYCKKSIDISTLLLEIFTALTFMGGYLYFGETRELIIFLLVISALAVTAVTDFKYYYVSDRVVFITLALELITYLSLYTFDEYKKFLLGAVVLFVVMLLVKLIGDKVFKRESLGGGDVKLMLIVGFTLGIVYGLLGLFFASLMALAAYFILNEKYNEGMIPFGPFLLLATAQIYIVLHVI